MASMPYYAPNSYVGQAAHRSTTAAAVTTPQQMMGVSPALAQQAKQQLEVLYEMNKLLSTGLTRDQLTICIQLVEAGMDPETLAAVVKEIKREASAMQRYR